VAVLAGADVPTGVRLGLAMTTLQLGIGAVNDVVDAPHDAGHKAGKPIPAGLVTPRIGWLVALAAFALGFALAAPNGPVVIGLAAAVIAIGLAYDLRLKGTAWSWLPFAVGIPLLPVFGWAGATGGLTPMFAILIPAAVAGGAALAIANGLVDVDRDRAAGVSSVAVALGEGSARVIGIALLVGITVAAGGSVAAMDRGGPAALIVGVIGCLPIVAAWLARPADPRRREMAWRAEAVGLALLAVAWIGVVVR
jgi:4-hydroxybenzoate polyprenyltransferase